TSLLACTWLEICPITSIEAVPHHEPQDKAYMAAGQTAPMIHTMAILQAFQAKMLQTLDEKGSDSDAFKKLHSATDLALIATKKRAQGIGRCMGSLFPLQRHLWLTLTDMRELEFLDAQKHCTPAMFQILFFTAFKNAQKTIAYFFLGSEGGPGASRETKSEAVPVPEKDGTLPFQCYTRSTAA
ncbi:hypothetical protein M9458_021332, partial [Cirrhinus mrigala]